jgi:hypothetical protein
MANEKPTILVAPYFYELGVRVHIKTRELPLAESLMRNKSLDAIVLRRKGYVYDERNDPVDYQRRLYRPIWAGDHYLTIVLFHQSHLN